ncbi:MAG: hypothetical protein H7Y07_02295 [Pyrinomonadaceae bacterium]|nr:hypothetical protein [Sphingobacteriaceae bacterium]
MKTGNYFRILVLGILWGMFPLIASANEYAGATKGMEITIRVVDISLIDSIPRVKRQTDKGKEKDSKKPSEHDKPEPSREPKVADLQPGRPNIKEIPRARPKLRPGVVTDRVKVKRPPVKIRGRGLHP